VIALSEVEGSKPPIFCYARQLMRYPLLCHPRTSCSVPLQIRTTVTQAAKYVLQLEYRLVGDLDALRNVHASSAVPVRREGLWQSTCLECFIRPEDSAGYYEFNAAMNGDWAAYRFDAYREGMRSVDVVAPALDCLASGSDVFEVRLRIDLSGTPLTDQRTWRLGISAVIETQEGAKSYWALHHPLVEKPDFHRREGFALQVAL
jgi:hypothetical protein